VKLGLRDYGDFCRIDLPYSYDLLSCHQLNPKRYPFLLESHQLDGADSGFDILFAFPGDRVECKKLVNNDFFAQLDSTYEENCKASTAAAEHGIPFSGGWFLFLSYELVGAIEDKLSGITLDNSLPVASAVRIPFAIIKNHADSSCYMVCESGHEKLIEMVQQDLRQLDNQPPFIRPAVKLAEDPAELFSGGVDKIKRYLIDGDTLQVNLSRQWQGELLDNANYLDLYRSLRAHNPSPFAGLACFGDSVICSSSPERLVCREGNTVQMRPIAGTRPRDPDDDIDAALAAELLQNSKENAEHIMLIDLIRNDLGRICETATVKVDETMCLESYAAVHHIVSNVRGELRKKTSPSDIIKAVFPGGTITGCPKVRCMEIINELEHAPRGAYTGSMGYLNRDGDLDLNILIRSFTVNEQEFRLRTGAGIVSDSMAEHELAETRHKAQALLDALDIQGG